MKTFLAIIIYVAFSLIAIITLAVIRDLWIWYRHSKSPGTTKEPEDESTIAHEVKHKDLIERIRRN